MPPSSRNAPPDRAVRQVLEVLGDYEAEHRHADIHAYRQNSASLRVRILDPDFRGLDRLQREDAVWALLEKLPDDVRADISLLLLLTPDEAETSLASFEFDNPLPSSL